MVTLPRNVVIAIVALAFVLAGALVWIALPESCSRWHDRYQSTLTHAINGTWSERRAVAIVESQRPEGC